MGVEFIREYDDIINDIIDAIENIDGFYSFIGVEKKEWYEFSKEERDEILKTMADDIFFGLGNDKTLAIGNGTIKYKFNKNCIVVDNEDKNISIIKLD